MCDLGRRLSSRWRQLTQHDDTTRPRRAVFSREFNYVTNTTEDCWRNHGRCTDWQFSQIL